MKQLQLSYQRAKIWPTWLILPPVISQILTFQNKLHDWQDKGLNLCRGAEENNFPSSSLPAPPSPIKGSRAVSTDALQRKSRVQRAAPLSCVAVHYTSFIIINIKSQSSSCEWKFSIFTFTACRRAVLLPLVLQAARHSPRSRSSPPERGRPRPPACCGARSYFPDCLPFKAGFYQTQYRRCYNSRFLSAHRQLCTLGSSLLERRELLEVKEAGIKDNWFQLVISQPPSITRQGAATAQDAL